MSEEFNPLRPLLAAMASVGEAPEVGECMEYDAWVPMIHPQTGERVNMRARIHDHFLLPDQIAELEAMLEGEAHNTPDDYYDGKD